MTASGPLEELPGDTSLRALFDFPWLRSKRSNCPRQSRQSFAGRKPRFQGAAEIEGELTSATSSVLSPRM